MAQITLDKVTFGYPGSPAATISELSLDVADGEAHALLGASGAGKTTFLNLLSGLLKPDSGRIAFDGIDMSQVSGKGRNVAQVFQFPVLYEQLTVDENLKFALRTRKLDPALIHERVDYLVQALALEPVRNKRPRQLSLFQKQLVQVGKALVRPDVSLVLLDEPLTAVEPRVKWELRRILKQAQADLGVTMIYVTHDQTEALTFADRVTLLTVDGALQTGTPAEIYERPSHEFVGHFVGSPGMNFIPADRLGITADNDADKLRCGFRPEWASLRSSESSEGLSVAGEVLRTRAEGLLQGEPVGLITLVVAGAEVCVRDRIDCVPGDVRQICIPRHNLYRDGLLVE